MINNGMQAIHPGEILLEEFMKPSDPPINANTLAKALQLPANRITAIIKGQRRITGDTAVLQVFREKVVANNGAFSLTFCQIVALMLPHRNFRAGRFDDVLIAILFPPCVTSK